jgi:dTDP-4-dehydrorhamnose reductase
VERGAHGIYHATGPEFVDRATLALQVCEHFGLPSASVLPRPTSELGQVARRSLRVRLDCSKLRRAGAPPFRAIADGLRALAGTHAPEGIR